MNNNTKKYNSEIPDEVLELIPWYVIGKLSVEDKAIFEAALTKYSALSEHLQQEMQMLELVSADQTLLNKSAIAAPEERLKAVFSMIDIKENQNQLKQTHSGSSLITTKLKSAFEFLVPSSMPNLKYAHVASAAVLVVSIAVLTAFVAPLFTQTSEFVPASADNQKINESSTSSVASNTTLLIGFNGTSIELGNNAVLKDKLLNIKSVPDKEGIYQISFKKALSAAEIKQTIDALLGQKELVWFAGEAF